MSGFWSAVATIIGFGMFLGGFAWLARRVSRSGTGGAGPFGAIQEQWDPAPYRTQIEVQLHDQRKAPTPAPGDPPSL